MDIDLWNMLGQRTQELVERPNSELELIGNEKVVFPLCTVTQRSMDYVPHQHNVKLIDSRGSLSQDFNDTSLKVMKPFAEDLGRIISEAVGLSGGNNLARMRIADHQHCRLGALTLAQHGFWYQYRRFGRWQKGIETFSKNIHQSILNRSLLENIRVFLFGFPSFGEKYPLASLLHILVDGCIGE